MKQFTLSIDWEDFGQLSAAKYCSINSDPVAGVVERQTKIILDLLDETQVKATFFILGSLAKSRPRLLKDIVSHGHEIGVHGLNHENMLSLSFIEAHRVLNEAKNCIEDISGVSTYGYRAPFFSLNKSNLYLLEILSELGFLYDSSIVPVKMPRYGIDSFVEQDAFFQLSNDSTIVELPLTVYSFFGKKIPVAGGGYMRLMPLLLLQYIFRSLKNNDNAGIIYMHPYEFDNFPIDISSNFPQDNAVSNLKIFSKNFRWNLFRNSIITKIQYLLNEYKFITGYERALYVKKNAICQKLLG